MEANQKTKEFIEEFLKKLTINFDEVTICDDGNNNFRFAIKSEDSGILIGKEGKNIKALNSIIKQIVRKNNSEDKDCINFFVDVNDYQTRNIERIKSKALEVAEKAIIFKRDIEMEPMTSFERMLVHSTLADKENVDTESAGERNYRRIVVKFKN